MGAKASTANGDHNQSPRTRTFSTSSSSDVVSGNGGGGFNLLRAIPGMQMSTQDRQRARSLSSVPDLQGATHESISIQPAAAYEITSAGSPDNDDNSSQQLQLFTATSLPSHWSLNGMYYKDIKCPFCSKFVLSDDIECHLVMCLTKPRLSYNEDILSDAKGECVICLEDLCPGNVIARLPCLCIYHKGCIDKWFEVNRSCPEHPGD